MKNRLSIVCFLLVVALCAKFSHAEDAPRPTLQILNGGDQPVDIFWLETPDKRVPNGSLDPGKQTTITTTLGHRFAIVGRNDKTETVVASEVRFQAYRVGGVPKFYTQEVKAHGFPIVASAQVNPYALKEAAYLIDQMLAKRPDVRDAMIKSGSRMCIMAYNEFTTDLPEFTWLANENRKEGQSAKDFWDRRARGLGGSQSDPFCSCGEENLLCYPGDPYSTENILIHEFAHNIHLRGLVNVDPTFDNRLQQAYQKAKGAGLWKGKYASVNHHEYFAEGVQSWFDNNRENDHDHNHVNTRDELIDYDPDLAALCKEVFGDTEIKYTKPTTRLTGHLEGYDPMQAPKFEWPARLVQSGREIQTTAQKRSDDAEADSLYETREVAGWKVHIQKKLLESDQELTDRALELLEKQLKEIIEVVPAPAVAELKKVPLYFSPQYPNVGPRAEYHPGAGWLRENNRDPAMVKGVEFTNIKIFEDELDRMPNFALHELAHAYHDRVLPNGFQNTPVAAAYARAKESGKYERVECRHGKGRPNTFERSYAMTNPMEYFAESSEAFFSRNDFFPFDKAELKKYDPETFELLEKLWNDPAAK